MSFLDSSDSEDGSSKTNLFSHASRQLASQVTKEAAVARALAKSQHSLARGPKSTPERRRGKRKSKDRGSDDDCEEGNPKTALLSEPSSVTVVGDSPPTTRARQRRASPTAEEELIKSPVPLVSQAVIPCELPVKHDQGEVQGEQQPAEQSAAEDTDDEFAEIARQARLEQRLRLTKDKPQPRDSPAAPEPYKPQVDNDPKVEIFLTSNIPGTQPLRVFLRLSQRLGMVREAWCKRQPFEQNTAQEVYLTYRKRRIYDASTPRSLGLDVDKEGKLYLRGKEEEQDPGRVHLEAVTDASAQQDPVSTDSGAADNGVTPGQSAEDEQIVRIVLRANKREDFKLRVRPTTTMAKIVHAYRQKRSVAEGQAVRLAFDGEELQPEQLIQDTEISDLDVVEVHIK